MVNNDFSIFPTLHTERLILKEIEQDDAEGLFQMRSNPEIMRYIDRPIPKGIEDVQELIQTMAMLKSKGEGISWGIYRKENPEVTIGNIGLFRIVAENYRAEIG
jgi:ribosomal-protein-alanine N-acetyltransferase